MCRPPPRPDAFVLRVAGLAALLVAACTPLDRIKSHPVESTAGTPASPRAPETQPAPADAPAPRAAEPMVAPAAVETIPVLAPDGDLWQHLRVRAGFVDCDQLSGPSGRWLQRFVARRHTLAPAFDRALPQIALVAAILAEHDLPAEFALLPMVESRYQPARPRNGGSAGIWQLMPATARGLGVPITGDYDGRLDTLVASRAAAVLLAQLGQRFDHDWRLVNMAFNAGEFRIRRALRTQAQAGQARDARTLTVAATTHAHLAQLEAMYCLVSEAERWQFALPASDRHRWLAAVPLGKPITLAGLADQAELALTELSALNPALESLRQTPDQAAHALLVRADNWSSVHDALIDRGQTTGRERDGQVQHPLHSPAPASGRVDQ